MKPDTPALAAMPRLPELPGQYRWQKTDTGARIIEDLRAAARGGRRRHVAHYPCKVLAHVLSGAPLEGEPWVRRADDLRSLLANMGVAI